MNNICVIIGVIIIVILIIMSTVLMLCSIKIGKDSDRMWQGYFEKLEKEKKNDSID